MYSELIALDWRQPLWLLVAIQPLLLWLFLQWKQKNSQQKFADEHLLPWLQVHQNKSFWQRLFSRNTAYFLAWLLFALALAGPRLPDKPTNNQNEIVLDVMLVVDLSRSMMATDIKPSRLRRATFEAYDFLQLAENTRVGITVYAARPHLFVPLTPDFNALKFYLKDMDTLQLPTQGSDASAALAFAKNELLASNSNHKQVILWLTDGDIEAERIASLEQEIQLAKAKNISIYIMGLGTLEGGAIPLGDGSWLESEGQAVISKMDSKLLQRLSEAGNGRFTIVSNDDSDWKTLYHQGILSTLTSPETADTQQWKELFSWVLFPAILLLVVVLFPFRFVKQSPNALLTIFALFLVAGNFPVYSAEKLYESNILQGIDAYKNADYAKSKSDFIHSVLNAQNDKERGIALHNLGNALFQTRDYASAAEVFTDALRYMPEQQQTIDNQQLTIALYTLLQRRRNRAMNQGNFAAHDDNAPLFDLPEQIPIMLSTKAVNLLKASLPKMPEEELMRLLDRDMQQFQLLEGDEKLTAEKLKEQQDIEQARIHFMGLEEKSSNALWKRLFEIEEGFPGKLKEPKTIPGVRPW